MTAGIVAAELSGDDEDGRRTILIAPIRMNASGTARHRFSLALLVLVLGIACNSAKPEDVVGEWSLSDGARQHLPTDLRAVATRLKLESDGTFSVVDLPYLRMDSSSVTIFPKSGRGTWRITRLQGVEEVQLVFSDGSGADLKIMSFPGSRPKLSYYLSDPDSNAAIELVRVS